jgi:hypothetical protein
VSVPDVCAPCSQVRVLLFAGRFVAFSRSFFLLLFHRTARDCFTCTLCSLLCALLFPCSFHALSMLFLARSYSFSLFSCLSALLEIVFCYCHCSMCAPCSLACKSMLFLALSHSSYLSSLLVMVFCYYSCFTCGSARRFASCVLLRIVYGRSFLLLWLCKLFCPCPFLALSCFSRSRPVIFALNSCPVSHSIYVFLVSPLISSHLTHRAPAR